MGISHTATLEMPHNGPKETLKSWGWFLWSCNGGPVVPEMVLVFLRVALLVQELVSQAHLEHYGAFPKWHYGKLSHTELPKEP